MAWIAATLLSVVVVVYNNVLNRWPPFHGRAYLPLNVGFAIAATALASAGFGLSRVELGLTGDLGDAVAAVAGVAAFGLVAFVVALSRLGDRIADRRVRELKGTALLYQALLRIPLGTALAEELLFRGVLFAAWRAAGASSIVAALSAAVSFGLWHITPTLILVKINEPEATATKVRSVLAGGIIFTTMAGLGLTWLRSATHGLLAPVVLHAGINSAGTVAAVIAGRRLNGTV